MFIQIQQAIVIVLHSLTQYNFATQTNKYKTVLMEKWFFDYRKNEEIIHLKTLKHVRRRHLDLGQWKLFASICKMFQSIFSYGSKSTWIRMNGMRKTFLSFIFVVATWSPDRRRLLDSMKQEKYISKKWLKYIHYNFVEL